MTFTEFLGHGISLFFHPFRTLTGLADCFDALPRKRPLSLGILSLLLGNVSVTLSDLIANGGAGVSGNAGALVLTLITSFAAALMVNVILVSLYYFFVTILSAQPRGLETLAGLYLAPELLSILLLPAAMMSRVLGPAGESFFGIAAFVLFVLAVFLKVKALSLSARWGSGRSVLVLVLPYAAMTVFAILSLVSLGTVIARIFLRQGL